jgi:hypothetical protein
MKWARCEGCVGTVMNGCRILVGEVERSCAEFGLVSFGSREIASVVDEVTRKEQDGMRLTGGDRRTRSKASPSVTFALEILHALAWDRTGPPS